MGNRMDIGSGKEGISMAFDGYEQHFYATSWWVTWVDARRLLKILEWLKYLFRSLKLHLLPSSSPPSTSGPFWSSLLM